MPKLKNITNKEIVNVLSGQLTNFDNDILVSEIGEEFGFFGTLCRFDATTFILCQEGEIKFEINMTEYTAHPGELMVILKGAMFQFKEMTPGARGYSVSLASEYVARLQFDFTYRSRFFINIRNSPIVKLGDDSTAVAKYYKLIHWAARRKGEYARDIIGGVIRSFCYLIFSAACCNNDAKGNKAEPRLQQIFDQFMVLLTASHARERNVKYYANEIGLSPNYLSSAVRTISGRSALNWINEYVINDAIRLLDKDDTTIKEISFALNFETQSAFGKYFKQQTGISPKQYRMRHSLA